MNIADATERLYRGVITNDVEAVVAALADDAFIAVPGLDRPTVGDLLERLHTGSFRTWSADSADVLASEHHGVVLDRWLRTNADGTEIDQHITMLAAGLRDDGRFGLFSIYGFDSAAIAGFWQG